MNYHIFIRKTGRVILITKSMDIAFQHTMIKDSEGNSIYDYQSFEGE